MRKVRHHEPLQDDLILAIGLIWGYLNTGQFEQADRLAQGCLQVWPSEPRLMVMAAFADVELARPLAPDRRLVLEQTDYAEWMALVLRRAIDSGEPKDASKLSSQR